MEALGRLFNVGLSATTAATPISLKNATGITIICTGATSNPVTVQECTDSAGSGAQDLVVITHYYRQASGVWSEVTQAAAATFSPAAGGLAIAEIETASLSDGYDYITASHASATLVLVPHDLQVQRDPTKLAAWTA